ncbi:MAG: RidA family protein [Christensenellales bacterium]|jgi:2-iminobutanoate/2-iminopropanoate deaminase
MKKAYSTKSAPEAIGPYSQAVAAGGFLFISGQIPLTPEGVLAGATIEDQTRQVLINLTEILKSAGLTTDNVVKTTVFLVDMEDFAAMNFVYSTFFPADCPARSAVQVGALPRGVRVEIEAIAASDTL